MNFDWEFEDLHDMKNIQKIKKFLELLIEEVNHSLANLKHENIANNKKVNFINEKNQVFVDTTVENIFGSIFDENKKKQVHLEMEESDALIGAIYDCQYCHYRNSSKKELKKHIKLHPESKGYKCMVCSREFKRLEAFQYHCQFGCKLQKHKSSKHHKSTQFIEQLINHEDIYKTIPNSDKYSKFDDKKSRKIQRLVSSLQKQKNNEVYSCSKCNKHFIEKKSLDHHSKMKHTFSLSHDLKI
ncbi:uncharacterized protein LOC141524056 [Cotesia typhae]|uniref:uncharacterized protein LOC141524056 n=1 Tax=Cotesia typhae TaxID=2053667 RepID=UPI003D68D4D3